MSLHNPPLHPPEITASSPAGEPELSRGHQVSDQLSLLPPYSGRFHSAHTVLLLAGALLLFDALGQVAGLTLRWEWFPYTPICMGLIFVLSLYNIRTRHAQRIPRAPAPVRYKLLSVLAAVAVFATVITPAN